MGFDFEIIYKAGIENKAADGLSRISQDTKFDNEGLLCALTVSSNLQMQDLLEEIDSNPGLQKEIQDIVQGRNPKKHYSIIKGRLFYKGRLVIPKTSKYIVIILQE